MRFLVISALLWMGVWSQTPCLVSKPTCFTAGLCGCTPSIDFCEVIPQLLNATQECACTNTTIIQPAECACTNTTVIQPVISSVGAAEYVKRTQPPNNSRAPGVAFLVDTEVLNTVPSSIVASAGAGGTAWTLSTGLYVMDYEMSLGDAASIVVMNAPNVGSLGVATFDTNTIAGSSTATTWIHGRAMINVASGSRVVAVTPHTGTQAVVAAGTATDGTGVYYTIRVTFLKLA